VLVLDLDAAWRELSPWCCKVGEHDGMEIEPQSYATGLFREGRRRDPATISEPLQVRRTGGPDYLSCDVGQFWLQDVPETLGRTFVGVALLPALHTPCRSQSTEKSAAMISSSLRSCALGSNRCADQRANVPEGLSRKHRKHRDECNVRYGVKSAGL